MFSLLGLFVIIFSIVMIFNPVIVYANKKHNFIKQKRYNYLWDKINNNWFYQLGLVFFGFILLLNGICIFYF